jgi:hypothetical protein
MNTNDKDKFLAEALNECFEKMATGNESIGSCLNRYPEHAAELKPLLETLMQTRQAAAISPDPTSRARARFDFQRALSDQFERKIHTHPSLRLRWATAISTLGVFLLAGGGGIMSAATNAMPGQYLYQLKRSAEQAQVELAPSKASEARLYASFADQRINEIVFAAQKGDAILTGELTQQFALDLGMVSSLARSSQSVAFGNDSKQTTSGSTEQSPPMTASLAPSVPGVVVTTPLPIRTTPASIAVSPAAPASSINLSGITDPVLLKLLQKYSAKNLSELMAILDSVQPEVKASLLSAIDAANTAYGQLLGS